MPSLWKVRRLFFFILEFYKAGQGAEGIAECPVVLATLGADRATLVQLVDVCLGTLDVHIALCDMLALLAVDKVVCKQ